jgi:hypothetical protein
MTFAFLAYPSDPPAVGQSFASAAEHLRQQGFASEITLWPEVDIAGRFIKDAVLEKIDEAECLVADITRLNFNVTFEIGYAIARGKRTLLVRNPAFLAQNNEIALVGIFDTVGYEQYENAAALSRLMRKLNDVQSLKLPTQQNRSAPVYFNQAHYKTDFETTILSRIKKARLRYRSFDPNESPRLSAVEAIREVGQSYGVLVHLLPDFVQDQRVHNLRAAFLAGLGMGFVRVVMLIQSGETPVPIDYRDLVRVCLRPEHYQEAIADFAADVTESLQQFALTGESAGTSLLEQASLGASSAENELTQLGQYYLETDQFQRARRHEIRLVTGRKGSGKTAIFFQLRDQIRQDKSNVVLDLKPEAYQLMKFKDSVLPLLAAGTVEHTITAFWEYLLLLEVCYKLLEKDRDLHKRDHHLFEPFLKLEAAYQSDHYVSEGDFSERMNRLLSELRQDFEAKYAGSENLTLSQAELTHLLYRHDVQRLRDLVHGYLQFKNEFWLLFDNIDKGWATHGVRRDDLVIVRGLIEATRKLERDLKRRGVDAYTVIFLRHDVYELLVEETPDRGKETRANVDWTDPDMLREVLRKRLVASLAEASGTPFESMWPKLCTSMAKKAPSTLSKDL